MMTGPAAKERRQTAMACIERTKLLWKLGSGMIHSGSEELEAAGEEDLPGPRQLFWQLDSSSDGSASSGQLWPQQMLWEDEPLPAETDRLREVVDDCQGDSQEALTDRPGLVRQPAFTDVGGPQRPGRLHCHWSEQSALPEEAAARTKAAVATVPRPCVAEHRALVKQQEWSLPPWQKEVQRLHLEKGDVYGSLSRYRHTQDSTKQPYACSNSSTWSLGHAMTNDDSSDVEGGVVIYRPRSLHGDDNDPEHQGMELANNCDDELHSAQRERSADRNDCAAGVDAGCSLHQARAFCLMCLVWADKLKSEHASAFGAGNPAEDEACSSHPEDHARTLVAQIGSLAEARAFARFCLEAADDFERETAALQSSSKRRAAQGQAVLLASLGQ
eukprot:TRINITY_DN32563_c0_g1_i1.p1 TRINITY_DN32563_c0_g1~~TRINITY_DN32563_c0_g1_i1.p1  ORF type:complete len:387 (+),score=77.39 TRINITY_DN32563_c0_g1_i1:139-1299(+)